MLSVARTKKSYWRVLQNRVLSKRKKKTLQEVHFFLVLAFTATKILTGSTKIFVFVFAAKEKHTTLQPKRKQTRADVCFVHELHLSISAMRFVSVIFLSFENFIRLIYLLFFKIFGTFGFTRYQGCLSLLGSPVRHRIGAVGVSTPLRHEVHSASKLGVSADMPACLTDMPGWRSSFPWGGCCTCRHRPVCRRFGLPPPRPLWRKRSRRPHQSRPPRTASPSSMAA